MIDLYVYYKVRESDAAALAPRVRAMQAALATRHGVAVQLKRRPGASRGPADLDGSLSAGVPTSFAGELEAAAAQAGLGP
jgi:hypothetical protein